jgi:hypothetical protein
MRRANVFMQEKEMLKVTAQKRLWDNYQEVGEVQKSDKIKFVIGAGIRDGVRYINIREFYYVKREDTWKPGRDGITIPLKLPIENGNRLIKPCATFMKVMEEAITTLLGMELADPDHAVYAPQKVRKEK